ncbi:ATP-binding protein [Oscillochloris sp. ZM17-4]|uniref:AAA family ATPase n=1 Tax=Oscillochloris sp. ZM17-4 TaxID=2866714 RepID=UPI001C72C040|nr:ATP-binding protein [Oscillochloris sp. ZM17-4]MBX0330388.1 ATP-binding protein [Oscillochloris sp. ZM17-4]
MIESFHIANFKSYRDATLPLAPLTLLIGANASGKSNAIEALRLLAWLAQGRRLTEILKSVQTEEYAIRGRVSDLAYQVASSFSLGCAISDPQVAEWSALDLTIAIGETDMRIREEQITASDERFPLYRVEPTTDPYSHDLQVSYNNFARGGRKPRVVATDQQAVFTQLITPARFGSEHIQAQKVIPRVTKTYQTLLEQILFLDPHPRRMRDYSFMVDVSLSGDGANMSSVLYDLVRRQQRHNQVLDFIRALPEQDIREISFVETSRNEVMIQLTETFGGHEEVRDAPLLSDGTLRVLAIAAALLSAPEGSLVVIEEIDNGVHPSRAQILLDNIQRVARARRLNILLTTHNPALLDALPLDAIPDVVCCYRDPAEGDSRLIRLEDIATYPELIAQGSLGDLVTSGVLDRFLKSRQTPGERRADALAWLDALEAGKGGG